MAPNNPLSSPIGKIRDTAVGALTDPVGTAGTVLHHAKGTAELGRSVVGAVASEVIARVPGLPSRPGGDTSTTDSELRPNPPVVPTAEPVRPHGDPLSAASPVTDQARRPSPPSATRKAAAKKTPAKKAAARKATPKKAPSKRAAVTEPILRDGAQDEIVYTTETPT